MTNWIVLQAADLNAYQVQTQLDLVRKALLSAGGSDPAQTDPVTECLLSVSNYVRGRIAANTRNFISGTALALPPELKMWACYLVIEALQNRVPGYKLDENQEGMVERAHDVMDEVSERDSSKRQFLLTKPVDPVTSDVMQGGIEVVNCPAPRRFTSKSMQGLL